MCQICNGSGFTARVYGPDSGATGYGDIFYTDEISVDPKIGKGSKISYDGWMYNSETKDMLFTLVSTGESRLYIDDKLVIHVQDLGVISYEVQGIGEFGAGLHKIKLNFNNNSDDARVGFYYWDNASREDIPVQAASSDMTPDLCDTNAGM